MNKWIEYEAEKRKIIETAKTSEEYERRINELIKKLGI
jgi:lipase chaperone LimK